MYLYTATGTRRIACWAKPEGADEEQYLTTAFDEAGVADVRPAEGKALMGQFGGLKTITAAEAKKIRDAAAAAEPPDEPEAAEANENEEG